MLDPLLWVGDPMSEMVEVGVVVCMLELVVRVRLLWVECLGVKQNRSCCIISCGYFMSEIYVRSNLIWDLAYGIWVEYLGMGYWIGVL